MKESQKKAALLCVLAFMAGMVIATSGCANRKTVIGVQSPIDSIYTVVQPPVILVGKVYRTH
jgi:hypothetical protein